VRDGNRSSVDSVVSERLSCVYNCFRVFRLFEGECAGACVKRNEFVSFVNADLPIFLSDEFVF